MWGELVQAASAMLEPPSNPAAGRYLSSRRQSGFSRQGCSANGRHLRADGPKKKKRDLKCNAGLRRYHAGNQGERREKLILAPVHGGDTEGHDPVPVRAGRGAD